ncbi:MAG: acetylornithine/succinylornithine family transaminase, partial [Lentisphaeria bacterium]|nr:acetylornithine/succinylornithine family transaminase [Lentisphaeria bacterium]
METDDLIAQQADYLVNTYAAKLALVKGQGAYVWDNDGNKYLDFTSGISVCNLGHCHPAVTAAIQAQAETLVHVSNLFINEKQPQLAKALSQSAFNGQVFFANSGAEANEGLIKFARKWGSAQDKHEIICMRHSFHGRTIATLAATDKPAIRKGFGPMPKGFYFADLNDFESIDTLINEHTAAVLIEPIQCEGGLIPATEDFIKGLRELCDKYEILLLFDEVQTGIGRTGELFAYQYYNVIPDAMSLAKALANGFPMGAFVINPKWKEVLGPSSHATTFGGTPLACAAALAVLETIEQENILDNVKRMGKILYDELLTLSGKYDFIKEVRGVGMLRGIQLTDETIGSLVDKAQELGLLILTA